MPIAFYSPGWQELVLILLVILIFFGAKRLPGLARSLGRAISEFKKGTQEVVDEIKEADQNVKEASSKPEPKKIAGEKEKDEQGESEA